MLQQTFHVGSFIIYINPFYLPWDILVYVSLSDLSPESASPSK
jgi:hypothetical protein